MGRICFCIILWISCTVPVRSEDHTDVTSNVIAAVKDNALSIAADNEIFGDTVSGVAKKLHVEYSIGGELVKRDVPEGERLEITAPAGQKLVIMKAIYGPADERSLQPQTVGVVVDHAALDVLPGFKIEHVLKADAKKHGSWICMARDPKGRLLLGAQRGQPITRVTLTDGRVVNEESLPIRVSETMGMLFVGNDLYLNGWGRNPAGKSVFGLFRCKDARGDERYDDVEFLREWVGGWGEHGAHGIALGPDNKLYVVCGNFTALPEGLLPSSPHRNYADDLVLKRAEDPNGFGAGRKPPGGFIVRMDLDGKNLELFAAGQRNTYDIAFNPDGELFGFDSDMEWDWGTPWYRPIRVFHAVRGADHGYREGSAKWPAYYPDSLPAVAEFGIGSPTGVLFGTGAKFPEKYQKALFILDWTYGRLIAMHLKPDGASYRATWENLVAPSGIRSGTSRTPLNLTAALIGGDGALYFTTGGRDTHANLFRVTYVGNEATEPAALHETDGAELRALRHKLEAFNASADPDAVNFAWTHLNSGDRYIRYAARLVLERNPVEQWQARALGEKRPAAALTALLALARVANKDAQPELLKALAAIPSAQLSREQQLEKLRVIEVSLARQGLPEGDAAAQLSAELDPLFPAKSKALNRELCQILLALNAPNAVARTIDLMAKASTQEDQLAYVLHLRNIKTGWTPELRRRYLKWWNEEHVLPHPMRVLQWFADAGIKYNNGTSFAGYLARFHEEAKFSMTPEELAALGGVLAAYKSDPPAKAKPGPPRKFVNEWKTSDLQPLLERVGSGRNFNRGKAVFEDAQCSACHRYGDRGGSIGPDLTAVSARFKRLDILESITEPSKVVSEQFMNTALKTADGKIIVGRIVQEEADSVVVAPNPLEPATVTVKKSEIKTRELSKISPMPEGLLNTFTKEEILDLLAFLESQGDPARMNFK